MFYNQYLDKINFTKLVLEVLLPALIFILFIFYHDIAHAYFDPGTGSLIIQGLVAALAGIVLFYKDVKFRIKNLITYLVRKIKKQ